MAAPLLEHRSRANSQAREERLGPGRQEDEQRDREQLNLVCVPTCMSIRTGA